MRWTRVLAGGVGVLVLAITGAAVLVATLDPNDYKLEIRAAAESATGRSLTLEGDLELSLLPRPSLTASDLRFANAPWGSDPDMVSIGTLALSLELLPLLSDQIEAERIQLSDVSILLERNDEGTANWQVGSGEGGAGDAGAAPGRQGSLDLDLRSAEIEAVTVTWIGAPGAAARTVVIDRLALESDDARAPLSLSVAASVDDRDLVLEGTIPAIADIARPGTELPIDLAGRISDTDIALAASLGYATAADGGLTAVSADRIALSLADMTATGRIGIALEGPRPRVNAEFQSERLVLPGAEGDGEGDPLGQALPWELLTLLDGQIAVEAGRVEADRLMVDNVALAAVLQDGVLTLDPVTADLSGGSLSVTARMNASAEVPRAVARGEWAGADFGALVQRLQGTDILAASGDAAFDLQGVGDTPRDLLNTAAGAAWFVVREGRVDNAYWELIAEDLTTRFLPFTEDGPERGTLNCATGRWTVDRGVADTTVLMADSDRVTIAGEGTIDLARATLDMKLTPRPKDASLVSLATPILVTGDLGAPTVAPDPLAVAKGVGTAVVGTMINPLALILPFVSSGADDDPCPNAIAVARAGSRPRPSRRPRQSNLLRKKVNPVVSKVYLNLFVKQLSNKTDEAHLQDGRGRSRSRRVRGGARRSGPAVARQARSGAADAGAGRRGRTGVGCAGRDGRAGDDGDDGLCVDRRRPCGSPARSCGG